MRNFVLLTILIIIGVLVNPESWGFWAKFVFKVLDLGGIALILYFMWNDYHEEEEPEEGNIPSDENETSRSGSTIFENKALLLNKSLHQNPDILEFLRKQFSIMWNLLLPHNGYLFLMLPGRELILIHKQLRADLEGRKRKGETIPAIDLIDHAEGFLVENHIDNGETLLPFYDDNAFEPRSFLGLRTDVDSSVRLYWLFDAEVFDFFNNEDRDVLHLINNSVLTFINKTLLTEQLKLENMQAVKSLMLSRRLLEIRSIALAVNTFVDFLINEFQASKLTIAFRKNFDLNAKDGVVYYSVGIEDPFKEGVEFPLEEGLNGWVILKNRPYVLDDIDKGEYFIPRFNRKEKSNYGLRSFLSVPIHFEDNAIGVVTLEDQIANKFSIEDKKRLIDYAGLFSGALNRLIQEKQIGGQING